MRELKLLVPVNDNAGGPLTDLHRMIRRRLVQTFKGYTETLVKGVWENPLTGEIVEEWMFSFTIAAQGSQSETQLVLIGEWIAVEAEQDAVYIRLLDGTVKFITAPEKQKLKELA